MCASIPSPNKNKIARGLVIITASFKVGLNINYLASAANRVCVLITSTVLKDTGTDNKKKISYG